jgi:hypothetical protein
MNEVQKSIKTIKSELKNLDGMIDDWDDCFEKIDKFLCESVCYDDCGFDPQEESKETLVAMFKANDKAARELLKIIRSR